MRKYTLASPDARVKVDLQDYEEIIKDAVHEIMPDANVKVCDGCYYVEPSPSKGQAIKIGRKICQSALAGYCIQIPKLFLSIEIEEEQNERTEEKCMGGHF